MLSKIRQFFKEYKRLAFVLVAIILALALDLSGRDRLAHLLLGVTSILCVIPLLWGMLETLRSGHYGVNILGVVAIFAAVALKEYWTGIFVLLMLLLSQVLENYAASRAKRQLSLLQKQMPLMAQLVKGNSTTEINVHDIKVGDRIMINPGDVVPVDSQLLDGATSYDESALTGQTSPVDKSVGDSLLGGSINIESVVTVGALSTANDSQYQHTIRQMRASLTSQSPFVRLTDRYTMPFTIFALLIAGGAWIFSGEPIRFLAVLVVASPSPLLLGAPIALISGLGRAFRQGIVMRSGAVLEQLAAAQTFVFNKTGVLTKGMPAVDSVTAFGKFDKTNVLEYASVLSVHSSHLLATAIADEATSQSMKIQKAKQVKELPGRGLSGRLGGKTVLVGSLAYLADEGVIIPAKLKSKPLTLTTTYVALQDELIGVITFNDDVRPEADTTLRQLHKMGIKHTMVVSGDSAEATNVTAKQLGIEHVHAEAMLGGKIHAIESAANQPVAYVGDGASDSPVLTASDVGIALGGRGSADVAIMANDLEKVSSSFLIAKRTLRIARQSTLFGILVSLALMVVFSTGQFPPIYGVLFQQILIILVVVNSMRAGGYLRSRKNTH